MNGLLSMVSPSWMFASTVVALLIVVAATALERVVQLRRGAPSRWVWAVAMVAAVGISGRLLVPEPVELLSAASGVDFGPIVDLPAVLDPATPASAAESVPPTAGERLIESVREARATVERLGSAIRLARLPAPVERGALALWILASVLFAAVLFASAWRLRRERRAWPQVTVTEHEVLVSEGFGPAIVGVRDPAIVIPRWVLALALPAQRTIVVHEDEHRRVGDQRLLLAALAVLALLPWNVGLWLMWRRLARAIEFDCDERVVARGVPSGEYAQVLLSAWQQSRRPGRWMPTPAFAERATGLGRRVEHLMRRTPRRRAMKALIGLSLAALCVAAAAAIPRPQTAAIGPANGGTAEVGPLVLIDGVKRRDLSSAAALDAELRSRTESSVIALTQIVNPVDAIKLYGSDGARGARALWTQGYLLADGAPLPAAIVARVETRPEVPNLDGEADENLLSLRARLMRGTHPGQEVDELIRQVFFDYQKAQALLMLSGAPDLRKRRAELVRARNAAARAFFRTEADRAAFDSNLEEVMAIEAAGGRVAKPLAANGESTPNRIVVIDGAKHPEVYTKKDRSAFLRQGADEIVLSQPEIQAKLAVEKYGPDGRIGADVYWTRKYIEGGGAILDVRAIPARPAASSATQERVIARYYALFRGITLKPLAMVKAYDALLVEENAVRPLAGAAADVAEKGRTQAAQVRNTALRALLPTKAEQDAFTANAAKLQPKGQAIPESEWGPPPLILIDGVKHKELNSAASMFAAMKDRKGDAAIGSIQHVDSINGRKLYGEDGRFGAVAVWTQGYVNKGGKFLPRAMVSTAESPALASDVKSEAVGKVIAKRLLSGVSLQPGASAKAEAIIERTFDAQRKLHGGPYLATWPKLIALQADRDKALRALAATQKDRAVFDANAKEEALAPLRPMSQVVTTCADNYFRSVRATAAERRAGEKACQEFTEKELALYDRVGGGAEFQAERSKMIAQRHAAVIAAMKDPAHKKQVEVLVDLWRKSDMDRTETGAKVVPSAKGEAEMKKALEAKPAVREQRDTAASAPGGRRVAYYSVIADNLMRGLDLSAEKQRLFRAVVLESSVKEWPLLGSGIREVVMSPELAPLQEARDAKLRAWLSTDAQRDRFAANARKQNVELVSLEAEAKRCSADYLMDIPASAAERDAVQRLCRDEFTRQRTLLRQGLGTLQAYYAQQKVEIPVDVRRLLSPSTQLAFDRVWTKRLLEWKARHAGTE